MEHELRDNVGVAVNDSVALFPIPGSCTFGNYQKVTRERRSGVCCDGISSTDALYATFSLVLLGTNRPSSSLVTQTTPPTVPAGVRRRTMSLVQHLCLSLDRCEVCASPLRRSARAEPPAMRSKTPFSPRIVGYTCDECYIRWR